ncbi:MAG: hypothetical protein RR936_08440 [Carnobacterium sp.]|uniref:hypothetical protein n=1 Tax=Carnobacterium sp. TaxID=48221 RepID=UPI002FC985E9
MNKQKLHPHLDRVIRIIYKELHFSEVLIFSANNYSLMTTKNRMYTEFDLDNKVFQEKIRHRYSYIYPGNYNYEEIDLVITFMCTQIKKRFNSTNALYLIPLVAESIINTTNNELFIAFDDLLEWDGYLNKLDSHIFIAAHLALTKKDVSQTNNYSVLKHDNDLLYDCLSKGISENHMHLKASGNITEMNWWYFKRTSIFEEELIEIFIKKNTFPNVSKEPESISLEREFIQKLKLITLLVEASVLLDSSDNYPSWTEIETVLVSNDVSASLLAIAHKITALETELFLKMKHMKSDDFIKTERIILKKSFEQLVTNKLDFRQQYFFNLYIIGMNYIKFQFYQDNISMGFSKFKEKEDNKAAFIPDTDKVDYLIYESVFDKYYREKRITKIEFRIGPKQQASDYYTLIDTLDRINDQVYEKYACDQTVKKIKYGIIVHYIKVKNKNDSVQTNIPLCRDETLRCINEKNSFALLSYFEEISTVDHLLLNEKYYGKIVAIDTANYEYQLRPEIFGTLFRTHKKEIHSQHNFHFTYHVGEDFNTLANGLRAIDETIEFLNFERNDRLGHASALGIQTEVYFKKKRTIITSTIQDYLDDIVWMYQLISSATPENYELLIYLKGEYEATIKDFYFSIIAKDPQLTFSLEDYVASYYLRGDKPDYYLDVLTNDTCEYRSKIAKEIERYYLVNDTDLNKINPLHFKAFKNLFAHKLYYIYHYDSEFKKIGAEEIIKEATDNYIKCVAVAQKILRQKIIDKDIFIEANPSSNKKISSISKYIDLPILYLNRYILEDNYPLGNVPVSINTDDSAIFQTNLTNEYSLVAAALIREGYAKEKVMDYIEYLANASNIHSFIND